MAPRKQQGQQCNWCNQLKEGLSSRKPTVPHSLVPQLMLLSPQGTENLRYEIQQKPPGTSRYGRPNTLETLSTDPSRDTSTRETTIAAPQLPTYPSFSTNFIPQPPQLTPPHPHQKRLRTHSLVETHNKRSRPHVQQSAPYGIDEASLATSGDMSQVVHLPCRRLFS